MKFGSLFTGIGGFDLGLERAGMECAWQVEIDGYCNSVLLKHWPKVKRYGDIRNCGQHNLEPVELICGGFPCQPFSFAGKRRGQADDRYLWPEMFRIIKELKPAWVIGENVAGIINMELEQVYIDLETEGYEVQALIIPACALNAPHRRDRVWILAYSISNQHIREESGSTGTQKELQGINQQEDSSPGESGRTGEIWKARKKHVANTNSQGLQVKGTNRSEQTYSSVKSCCNIGEWWTIEPQLGRVASRISHRVDRLRTLGNAVVPQIVQVIGAHILRVNYELCTNKNMS